MTSCNEVIHGPNGLLVVCEAVARTEHTHGEPTPEQRPLRAGEPVLYCSDCDCIFVNLATCYCGGTFTRWNQALERVLT